MTPLLFVYGTLRSEFENQYARVLRAGSEFLGRATVQGAIFNLGRYPGFVPEPAGKVTGELYRLLKPAETLRELDEWEGEAYERVVIGVWHGDVMRGEPTEQAWIYRYLKLPPEAVAIPSGDFCAQ